MKKPKSSQLPQRTHEERRRQSKVAEELENMHELLGEVRQASGRGRFGELDDALGREAGFVVRALKGQERMSTERLLTSVNFLGMGASEFFERAFPPAAVPPSPIGFLPARREKVRRAPLISFLTDFVEWGQTLRISHDDGANFTLDIEGFQAVLNVDRPAAFRMACASLEGLLVLKPSTLNGEGASNLCRVLGPLAEILRHRGDRNSACELLDLAFRLESSLNDLALRASLFRSASYLLCDLAYLDDANYFARKSVVLSTLGGDLQGIGRSLYVQGEMLHRSDEPDKAVPILQASLQYLPETDRAGRAAALFALAYIRMERGDWNSVVKDLGEIETLWPAKEGRDYAKIALAKAELESKRGNVDRADMLFLRADEHFSETGSIEDVAICGTKRMRHLLATGRTGESIRLAQKLLLLSGQLRHNKAGQAFLLEIVNLARQGELTLSVIENVLSKWLRPWQVG